MANLIRVLVADDHTLVREGVRLLLSSQPDFLVVAEAADGATTIRLANELCPDIILLDLRMPEVDGIQAFEQIHAHHPQIKALILTMSDEKNEFFRAMRAGVSGYFLKGASSSDLIQALRVVAAGEIYLPPHLATFMVEDFRKSWRPDLCNGAPPVDVLSQREVEVLQHLANGQTNAEIATLLAISASTVQTHRTRILEKLGLKTRSDLVKYALRHSLICLG